MQNNGPKHSSKIVGNVSFPGMADCSNRGSVGRIQQNGERLLQYGDDILRVLMMYRTLKPIPKKRTTRRQSTPTRTPSTHGSDNVATKPVFPLWQDGASTAVLQSHLQERVGRGKAACCMRRGFSCYKGSNELGMLRGARQERRRECLALCIRNLPRTNVTYYSADFPSIEASP